MHHTPHGSSSGLYAQNRTTFSKVVGQSDRCFLTVQPNGRRTSEQGGRSGVDGSGSSGGALRSEPAASGSRGERACRRLREEGGRTADAGGLAGVAK